MPLYEFECHGCGTRFERLVRGPESSTTCPSCNSSEIERLLSLFAVNSESTRAANLEKGRRAGAKERRDRKHAEIEAIEHHHH
jgi:putative FmdB family regulatory protein